MLKLALFAAWFLTPAEPTVTITLVRWPFT
jgi:hypothetical protein